MWCFGSCLLVGREGRVAVVPVLLKKAYYRSLLVRWPELMHRPGVTGGHSSVWLKKRINICDKNEWREEI
jgi:hypothetical protein